MILFLTDFFLMDTLFNIIITSNNIQFVPQKI